MLDEIENLQDSQKILLLMAILIDGGSAHRNLSCEGVNGRKLEELALKIQALSPDMRIPLVGTLLRRALERYSA